MCPETSGPVGSPEPRSSDIGIRLHISPGILAFVRISAAPTFTKTGASVECLRFAVVGSSMLDILRVDAAVMMDVITIRCTVATLSTAVFAASIVSCDKSPTAPVRLQELPTPDPTIQSIRSKGHQG